MPLGTEVGLGPGYIVLDRELGTQLPQGKGQISPHFSAHFALARSPISQQLLSSCRDMSANRQTDRHIDMKIAILCTPSRVK